MAEGACAREEDRQTSRNAEDAYLVVETLSR